MRLVLQYRTNWSERTKKRGPFRQVIRGSVVDRPEWVVDSGAAEVAGAAAAVVRTAAAGSEPGVAEGSCPCSCPCPCSSPSSLG